ncbi:MAG TPA: lysylphosphatidylglycerol synthase transmembrane domain-containing protein [Blastocatellia bacterium]|nr:lysylphosphatidylglycerol synthase transmembrane domain-containing protein [Blastocatellia bacterium]
MDQLNADRGLRIAGSSITNSESANGAAGGARERQFTIRSLQFAIGYLLAGAGLIWALRGVQPARLLGQLTLVNWRLIALSLVCDVSSYVCQGARWRLLLKPVGEVTTLQSTQAIYAGLFTNEILPMRVGELVRAYLMSRRTAVRFVAVIPSMVVERLFDSVWLAAGIGLVAIFVPLPKNLLAAGDALGVIAGAATGLFLLFAFRRPGPSKERRLPDWWPIRAVSGLFVKMSGSLRGIGRTRAFYLSFAYSLALLILQTLAFWLAMRGYGVRLSFWAGAAVYLIVHLGTAIPNAPANVGSYQFFTVIGLMLFGVDKSLATGFSLIVFALLTLPLLLIGFVAFSRSGMTLASIRRNIESVRR